MKAWLKVPRLVDPQVSDLVFEMIFPKNWDERYICVNPSRERSQMLFELLTGHRPRCASYSLSLWAIQTVAVLGLLVTSTCQNAYGNQQPEGNKPDSSVVTSGSAKEIGTDDVTAGKAAIDQEMKEMSRDQCLRYLAEGTAEERIQAIRVLVRMGELGIKPIVGALTDQDPGVRAEAIVGLGQLAPLGAELVVPRLIERMAQDDGFVNGEANWVRASQAIGKYREKVLPILEKEWENNDPKRRAILCVVCYELGPVAAPFVQRLIALVKDGHNYYRRAAIGALMAIGPEAAPAVPVLRKQLYHEDFHTQYWACRALGAIGSQALPAVPDLVDRLKNGVASVRRNAAAALGKLGPQIGPEAVAALIQAVDDPIQPVREQAVLALGRIGPEAAGQAREAIENSHEKRPIFPRSAATWAIWRLGGPIEPLAESLIAEIKEGVYREEATALLYDMGSAGEPVRKKLEESLPEVAGKDPEKAANIEEALKELGAKAQHHEGETEQKNQGAPNR